MKFIYTFLLLFTTLASYSQIDLEHSYAEGYIYRTSLEISGEKYFYNVRNDMNAQCVIYNADHSLWKTIDLPVPEDAVINLITISHISETKINPDNNVEVSYSFQGILDGINIAESRIVNENGSVLFSVEGANISVYSIEGLPNKIISFNSGLNISEVYSLPELILENEYAGRIHRINLENSGEKYYFINEEETTMDLYNTDHTFWKTIDLTIMPEATVNGNVHISENRINTDDLLEVIYRTMETNDGIFTFTTYVINEDGEVLLTVEDGWFHTLNEEEGLDDKLLVHQVGPIHSNVYTLPGLNLEHTYNVMTQRVKLESFGEKYFNSDPADGNVQLYNADHTPWMSIDPAPGTSIENLMHLSESKIDPNDQIEIIYSSYNEDEGQSEGYVTNQNGEILLAVPDDEIFPTVTNTILYLSEIPGLQNKLIVDYYEPSLYISSVYSLPSWTLGFDEAILKENISIFPNPSTGYITIDMEEKLPENIAIYAIDGKLITEINNLTTNLIDVSFLSSGFYLLVGKEDKQTVFSEKFVVE